MKRTVGLVLIICMVFLLSACAETSTTKQETETENSVGQTGTEAAETATTDRRNGEEHDSGTDTAKAKLLYMGQASIRITTIEGKVIYIDPYVGDG